jgi:hypothetical protein
MCPAGKGGSFGTRISIHFTAFAELWPGLSLVKPSAEESSAAAKISIAKQAVPHEEPSEKLLPSYVRNAPLGIASGAADVGNSAIAMQKLCGFKLSSPRLNRLQIAVSNSAAFRPLCYPAFERPLSIPLVQPLVTRQVVPAHPAQPAARDLRAGLGQCRGGCPRCP